MATVVVGEARAEEAEQLASMYEWLFAPPGAPPPGWTTELAVAAIRRAMSVTALMAYRYLGLLRAEQGEFDAAARALDQAEPQMHRTSGSMSLAPQASARITLELWAGRPNAAAAVVSDCLDRVRDSESLFFTARVYDLGARECADLASRAPGNRHTSGRRGCSAARRHT